MSEPKPEPERLRPVSGEVRAPVGPTALDEELTFRALFFQIVRGKWIILATMAVLVGLVTVWMKTTEPLYTASMVIAPTGEAGAGGMAGRLLQYGDLASLAGINLPSAETVSPSPSSPSSSLPSPWHSACRTSTAFSRNSSNALGMRRTSAGFRRRGLWKA